MNPVRLSDVLLEEGEGAVAGDLRAVVVEAAALVAVEAVAGAVDVDLDRAAFLCGADLVDLGQRDGVVLVAEMHDHRTARLFLRDRADAAAIIGRRGGEAV